MPTYEYECPACGAVLERDRSMKERHKAPRCPTCRRQTRLMISSTSFLLRGTGWYATDYAKSDKPK